MALTREEYLKHEISEKGYTLKEFAARAGLPYTTLLSILNKSLGGAGIDNVIKICKALEISIDSFQREDCGRNGPVLLTAHEKQILEAYRKNADMRAAVDRLLAVERE